MELFLICRYCHTQRFFLFFKHKSSIRRKIEQIWLKYPKITAIFLHFWTWNLSTFGSNSQVYIYNHKFEPYRKWTLRIFLFTLTLTLDSAYTIFFFLASSSPTGTILCTPRPQFWFLHLFQHEFSYFTTLTNNTFLWLLCYSCRLFFLFIPFFILSRKFLFFFRVYSFLFLVSSVFFLLFSPPQNTFDVQHWLLGNAHSHCCECRTFAKYFTMVVYNVRLLHSTSILPCGKRIKLCDTQSAHAMVEKGTDKDCITNSCACWSCTSSGISLFKVWYTFISAWWKKD